MPDTFDGRDIYKHLYVDRDILPDKYYIYPIVSEYVSTETKDQMLQDCVDTVFAFKIIRSVDVLTLPFDNNQLNKYASSHNPDIHTAEASLEFLRVLVTRFEDLLIDFGGKADMETLYLYLKPYIDNRYQSGDESVSLEVRYALHEMFKAIKFSNYKTTGTTYFFRQVEDWINIKQYFADVVEQKVVNGDYTFIIRSVGSSTGREAYSLALILERTLCRYAEALYADEQNIPLKYDQIEKWIDLWHINVYAYDSSFDRLKETAEGIYNGDDWGLRHYSEFKEGLFDRDYRNNPADTSFVREIFNGSGNETQKHFTIRVNLRLRRWITPIYCNLNFDAEMLYNYKAEVTFALNTIPYLSYPQDEFIKILKESLNPKYKAFCVYNTEYDVAPEDHNVVEDGPQVICVKELPAVSKIISTLLNHEISSREELAGYFGLDQNLQDEIFVEYDLNPDEISIPQIDRMIDRYQSMPYFTDIETHAIFNRDVFRPFIESMAMRFALSEMDSQITKKALDVVGKKLINRYSDKVRELGIDGSVVNNFGKRIQDFLSLIDVAGTGHLFMPIIVAGEVMYEHTYLDRHAFVPSEEQLSTSSPEVVTEVVSKDKKQMLIADLEDTKHALKILNMHEGIVGLFGSYELYYESDKRYLKVMEDRLALALLEPLRKMVEEHKSLLEDKYGSADMFTLRQHVTFLKGKKTFETQADEKFNFSYIKIINLIRISSHPISLTAFFRKRTYWKSDLENYLKDLVFQKVIAGDRTISVKSVGSSEGREAYSIALLIENALVDYAENYLYEKESDAEKKSNLVQQWVGSWDVSLYAMDINPCHLAHCKEGIYPFPYSDEMGFPSHLESIFEKKILSKDGMRVYGRVKRRFREWLKPVQCDLKHDLNVLFAYKTDITMAMNIYPYLDDVITPLDFEVVLKNATTSDYKIFISWNDTIEKTPNSLMIFDSQPLVLPVKTVDEARILSVIDEIEKRGMYWINIPEFLGIMPGQLENLVDKSEFDMQEKIDEYHLTRDLADSMI